MLRAQNSATLVLVGVLALAQTAAADEPEATAPAATPSDEQRELALRLGREGVALYNEQRFEDALDRFTNAEAIVHSPVFVVYMARIARKRGQWRKARALFDTVLAESFPIGTPEPWLRVRDEAALERERLVAVLPTVRVDVADAEPSEVSLWIDGEMITGWTGGPIEVDPGKHQIAAQHLDRAARRRFAVKAGDKDVRVRLAFEAPATDPSVHSVGPRANPPPPDPPVGGVLSDQAVAGYTFLGLGGAAALAALGVGVGIAVHYGGMSDACYEGRCPTALTPEVDTLDDLNRACLGLGIASATLLITSWIVLATAPAAPLAPATGLVVDRDGVTLRW